MIAPYWDNPGVSQGRVNPTGAQPPDGSHLFVLGHDAARVVELPQYELRYGDVLELWQDATLSGSPDYLRFSCRMRTESAPHQVVLSAGSATFIDGGVLLPGDSLQAIDLSSLSFPETVEGRTLRVSGSVSPANDGDFRCLGLPRDQSSVTISPVRRYAIIDNPNMVAETGPAVTIQLLGLRWRAQLFVNGQLGAELVEDAVQYDRDGYQRADLSVNVSQLPNNAPVSLLFRLKLEAAA